MSRGACTNFCKSSGSVYAFTSEGSTCHCSNAPPADSSKVDDSKCDKPCMGYPFENCGGTSGHGLANVLLIGGSVGTSPANSGDNSSSGSSPNSGTKSSSGTDANSQSKTNSDPSNEDKALNAISPDESSKGSGSNVGAITAGIMAVFGFGVLFAVAVVFSKRRRARIDASWKENMSKPSSLVHYSNDDELEGQDYTRATPIYQSVVQQAPIPTNPTNIHLPPPPVLHPRQSGTIHMTQHSYPAPMIRPRYNSFRGHYQPYAVPPMLTQQQFDHVSMSHKEPLGASPPAFSRGPQTLRHALQEDNEDRLERTLSHTTVRSYHQEQRAIAQRESVDSIPSTSRASIADIGYYGPDH
ncbi:hypothetical protein EDD11_007738 [Mortierella claussenii]|nr:hypothetical protein EDD11_007738 [Mortierella claussenii]